MAIDKAKLFESARERWPSSPVTASNGAAIYRAIEEACKPTGEYTQHDEWTQLANWAFHQAIGALARDAGSGKIVRREDVTFDVFDEWMRFNLADECWEAERREYEASPSRFH
jgi:hypothetical protein